MMIIIFKQKKKKGEEWRKIQKVPYSRSVNSIQAAEHKTAFLSYLYVAPIMTFWLYRQGKRFE